MATEYFEIALDPSAFPPSTICGIERSCHNAACGDVSRWPILTDADPFAMLALARAKGGCA